MTDTVLKLGSHSSAAPTENRHEETTRRRLGGLLFQRLLGWMCLLPLSALIIGLMRWRGQYRILRHSEIRRQFRHIVRSRRPLLVCANHLTLIDSILLIWALASIGSYVRNYRLFCWNLPAVENTRKHRSWCLITYLSKCILLDRLGGAEHTGAVLAKVCDLLRCGELVMLFPEGTRSRNGRVDQSAVTYGVGRILQEVPDCNVLCAYLRGREQESYSDFPKRGEMFDIALEVMKPETTLTGLRGARERSMQVVAKLKEMEDHHFAKLGTSHYR